MQNYNVTVNSIDWDQENSTTFLLSCFARFDKTLSKGTTTLENLLRKFITVYDVIKFKDLFGVTNVP